MQLTIKKLLAGFESSSGLTEEFRNFYMLFKREFSKELRTVGATNIKMSRGHFFVSGFFTVNENIYYFSLGDVRGMDYALTNFLNNPSSQLMYRTAKDYKDYTGGCNQWVTIKSGMAKEMKLSLYAF